MVKYKSTHTGQQIDDAIDLALDTIPTTGDYAASSANKLTPVSQVNDIVEEEIIAAISAAY